MRLFHFNMVKMPSFYPVFSFGMPEAFYWLSLWNFKKETSTISCGTAGFFHSIHFYLLSYLVGGCFLPERTPFAQPPHQTKALGGERNPFWRKIFPFLPQPHLPFSKDFRVYRIPVLWFYGMRPSVRCIIFLKRHV